MPETIAITAATIRDENNEIAQNLKALGYDLAIHPKAIPPSPDELDALLANAVGFIAGAEPVTREAMAKASKLRVVSRNGVGYDAVDLDAATELGIVVAYVPGAMVNAVADLTLALLLSAARRLTVMDAACKRGEWARAMAADVTGQTLGLIGTGRIGQAVAQRARGFDMRIIGYDPYPNARFTEELGGEYVSLDELLEQSDFVSLHLPASAQTHGLIGADQLARMKPTAFLINTARGTVVDEAALVDALKRNAIAGAATDVYSTEPPVAGSPAAELMTLPNVVATPHTASFTPITARNMGLAAMENMLTVLRNERPEFIANPEVYTRGLRFA